MSIMPVMETLKKFNYEISFLRQLFFVDNFELFAKMNLALNENRNIFLSSHFLGRSERETIMKILSIRKGFQADHSSTSYEFYAIKKPLNETQQAEVSKLSSRAMPTKRHVSFIYHGEWSDLPGGWEPLVEKYYDIMYSESYDWWTLAFAFNTKPDQISEIMKYEFYGIDDLGVTVDATGNRVIISILCRLYESGLLDNEYNDDYYGDSYDEDEDYEDEEATGNNNALLELLRQNWEYLKEGDYRLLYGVWQEYGITSDSDKSTQVVAPPEPLEMDDLPEPIQELLLLLEQ
jgi:hypothetical protein